MVAKELPPSSSPSTSGEAWAGPGWAAPGQVSTKGSLLLIPREFRFTSEVPIWLDYHGKHISMDQVVSGAVRHSGSGSPFCSGVACSLGPRVCIQAPLATESVSCGLGRSLCPIV